MITKEKAEQFNTARGVSIRFNANDIASAIQLAFTFKGILCRETVGFTISQTGLNAATNLLGEIKNKIANGTFFYADYFPKSKKLALFGGATTGATVKVYLDKYIDKATERGLSPSTITGYKKSRSGLKALWDMPVSELEPLTFVNLVENATVSAKTLSNRLSVLRSALDQALIEKVIKTNPLAGFKIASHMTVENKLDTRKKHKDVTPFTPNEIDKITEAAKGTERAIIELCNETGLRSSEWVALKKADVCLISLEIDVYEAMVEGQTKDTKTKAGKRTIPITQSVADLLEDEMNKHDSDYVFVNSKGKPWNQDSFRKHQWSAILKEAGVKYRYPYQLRHTFATRLISQGENVWKIAKYMGHKSPELIYQHYGNFIDAYEKKLKREKATQ